MKTVVALLVCSVLLGTHTVLAQNSQRVMRTIKLNTKPGSLSAQQRGYLGVYLSSHDEGVEIQNTIPNSAAVTAGLKRGDVLVSINNQRVQSVGDVSGVIGAQKPGETVSIVYTRNGATHTTSAVLGKQEIPSTTYYYDYNINDNWGAQPIHTSATSPCEQLRELQGTAFLGVWIESSRSNGAYINGTIQNTGAVDAGLQRGDVITDIDGQKVSNYIESLNAIRSHKPGDVITVTYTRDGETRSTSARLVSIGETKRELVKVLEAQCTEKTATPEPIKGVSTEAKVPTVMPVPSSSATITVVPKNEAVVPVRETPSLKGESLNESINTSPRTLSVAPNPATGIVNMNFTSTNDAPFSISVVDASGRTVLEQKVSSISGSYSTPLDLTSLARGVYMVNVRQGNNVYSEKVILQ